VENNGKEEAPVITNRGRKKNRKKIKDKIAKTECLGYSTRRTKFLLDGAYGMPGSLGEPS
jgi:hypothetical protein